jgi:hypothetical protein
MNYRQNKLYLRISVQYNQIFSNEINLLKNLTSSDVITKFSKIQYDLFDSYLKDEIDKEYYNLLNEKILELEKNNNNNYKDN